LPLEVATSAALPVDASGELASMVTLTTPADTVALIVGSCEAEEPGEDDDEPGDVGLPPHPATAVATAASDMVCQDWTQNSRREYFGNFMRRADRNSRAANRTMGR
jgi:hypothetical protein